MQQVFLSKSSFIKKRQTHEYWTFLQLPKNMGSFNQNMRFFTQQLSHISSFFDPSLIISHLIVLMAPSFDPYQGISAEARGLNPDGSGCMRYSVLLPSVASISPSATIILPLSKEGERMVFHMTSPSIFIQHKPSRLPFVENWA